MLIEPHLKTMSDWCATRRGSKRKILDKMKAKTTGYISAPQLSRWLSDKPDQRVMPSAENFLLLVQAYNETVKEWKDV